LLLPKAEASKDAGPGVHHVVGMPLSKHRGPVQKWDLPTGYLISDQTLKHASLPVLLQIPGCVLLLHVCVCLSVCVYLPAEGGRLQKKKKSADRGFARQVTMYLPGMVTCGCPSFNKRAGLPRKPHGMEEKA
jgi:hypothetical protein